VRSIPGAVTAPRGFRAAAVRCGIKTEGPDLTLIVSDGPAALAALFTTNQVKAAPVLVSQEHTRSGCARAIVASSGNANCCTGERGLSDARRMAELAAEGLGLVPEQVLVASTGVIGHALPMGLLEAGIPRAVAALSPESGEEAARGIMTTDTRPKSLAVEVEIGGRPVRIGGIAKGVGMIEPNMATLLSFITTDAPCDPRTLREVLVRVCDQTFHCLTVDSDTSTNDTLLLLANGASGGPPLQSNPSHLRRFEDALRHVALYLVKEIARDGEGATRLIQVQVDGCAGTASARQVAKSIANSPLVKTAIFGQDPNWGRLMMAAGKAGVPFSQAEVQVWIGDQQVVVDGAVAPDYSEVVTHAQLTGPEVSLRLRLGPGPGQATVYTCDFSYDYVKINAEYHT
jgi:glutamate N-acetyltransferase/amino-acid N-acetyltransferase